MGNNDTQHDMQGNDLDNSRNPTPSNRDDTGMYYVDPWVVTFNPNLFTPSKIYFVKFYDSHKNKN